MEQIDIRQPSKHSGEQLFLDHLTMIQRLSAAIARQYRLSVDDAEEFAATVQYRLIVDDYAVLRKFRHQSSVKTFLTVVIQRICLDFRQAQWGKWRPSAAAQREGAVAIRLERLTMRDGLTFDEACAVLVVETGVTLERETLARIYSEFRVRARPRVTVDTDLCEVQTTHLAPDRPIVEAEQSEELSSAVSALGAALSTMPARDQLLLKLRFADDLPVAAVARLLRLNQKWLYRRYAWLFGRLRKDLESHGVKRGRLLPSIGEGLTAASIFSETIQVAR